MENKKSVVRLLNKGASTTVDRLNGWLKKYCLSLERIVAALFAALLLAYVFQLTQHGEFTTLEAYYNCINFVFFIPIAVVAFGTMILLTVRIRWSRLIPIVLLASSVTVSVLWIVNYCTSVKGKEGDKDTGFFITGVVVFELIILIWVFVGNKLGITGLDRFRGWLSSVAARIGSALHSNTGAINKGLGKIHLSLEQLITTLLAAVLAPGVYRLLSRGEFASWEELFTDVNVLTFVLLACSVIVLLLVFTAALKLPYFASWMLMTITVILSVLLGLNYRGEEPFYFALGAGAIVFVIALWLACGDKMGIATIRISRWVALGVAGVLFVGATVAFGYFTSLKYATYNTYTFDFGIFSQMFERMAETGQPFTTVERSYMMLHYGVHFSPFFYLFLPGYYIFRSPIYLYYVQAAGIAAGVFAVWLLSGKLGLSGKLTLALEALYLFYPCLFNGAFYDFHENKFLTAIILFLFYFIVSRKPLGIFVLSLLLLSVKEDAALYLMVIAVYVIINRKEVFTGAVMLVMAIAYFVFAQWVVANAGVEGVMMSRLEEYFINGEKTFGSVVKAVIFDLGHTIGQVFTGEKFPFVIWMLAPVAFAPFVTKKISSLVLLLPILPINLMQKWSYQYNVDYQYTYGVAALVILSAIFILVRLSPRARRTLLLTALCVSMMMSIMLTAPKIRNVTKNMNDFKTTYQKTDEVLELIPDDATVTASDAFVPHLYKIKWLFTAPDYYSQNWSRNPIRPNEADYVVIDTRYKSNPQRGVRLMEIMGGDYTLIASGGFAELYERNVKVRFNE